MNVRRNLIGSFAGSRNGNFVVTFALISSMLLTLVGGAIDFVSYSTQKKNIQATVDAAALAAVSEANLKGWNEKVAIAVAEHVAESNYRDKLGADIAFTVETTVDPTNRQVHVKLIQDHYPYFYKAFFPSPQITTSATATAAGSTNVCVIGLELKDSGTISLTQQAVMTAGSCAVYSNSTSRTGLGSTQNAIMNTGLACSAGGYSGSSSNYATPPITDCPSITDPLENRSPPTYTNSCDYNDFWVKSGSTVTISPGVYCGGIDVGGNSVVTVGPGIYIIKDGPIDIYAGASFVGEGVGLYFTGSNAYFSAYGKSIINLKAPSSGSMAGLLMFQDRKSSETDFVIKSKSARNLLGTIYLPNGNFIVDANNKIAEDSAYTAIVARRVQLGSFTDLVLNTDYNGTTVPVPTGLGPSRGSAVRLER